MCLQETIRSEFSSADLRKLVGGLNFVWHSIPAIGHSGGILVAARSDSIDVTRVDQGRFFVVCLLFKN